MATLLPTAFEARPPPDEMSKREEMDPVTCGDCADMRCALSGDGNTQPACSRFVSGAFIGVDLAKKPSVGVSDCICDRCALTVTTTGACIGLTAWDDGHRARLGLARPKRLNVPQGCGEGNERRCSMGLPHRRCANCRHFVHGSPRERDFWPTQHGHCYQRLHEDQGAPPYPVHANSRGCEKYEEKETCGTCSKFVPKHTGNGGQCKSADRHRQMQVHLLAEKHGLAGLDASLVRQRNVDAYAADACYLRQAIEEGKR